jgi:hypothetical protein
MTDTIAPFKPFHSEVPPAWKVRLGEMVAQSWAVDPKDSDHDVLMRLVIAQLMEENSRTPPGPLTMAAGMLFNGSPEAQKAFFEEMGDDLPPAVQAEFQNTLFPYGKGSQIRREH